VNIGYCTPRKVNKTVCLGMSTRFREPGPRGNIFRAQATMVTLTILGSGWRSTMMAVLLRMLGHDAPPDQRTGPAVPSSDNTSTCKYRRTLISQPQSAIEQGLCVQLLPTTEHIETNSIPTHNSASGHQLDHQRHWETSRL
jgi:hypothetical protein